MRYRKVRRTRTVTHTREGKTHEFEEPYDDLVPAPPPDIDRAAWRGLAVLAVAMLIVSISWSTASIGSLLSRAAPAVVAYGAATVFDALWIGALAFEWLARYQPNKQALPRRVGHLALTVAMAAVAVNGWLAASPWVGVIGALVSAAAKVMWIMALRHTAVRFDSRTEKWVELELGEAGATMAMIPVRRQVMRAEQTVQAERAALAATAPRPTDEGDARPAHHHAHHHADGAPHGARHDAPHDARPAHHPRGARQVLTEQLRSMDPGDAIRLARNAHPRATPEELAELLAGYGITVDALLVALALHDTPPAHGAPAPGPEAELPAGVTPIGAKTTKATLVRDAATQLGPHASSTKIAKHVLAQHGVTVDPGYIRSVLLRTTSEETPEADEPAEGGQL